MLPSEEMDRIPFLRNLGEPYARQLASIAKLQEYPEGTVLFAQGQDFPWLYLLIRGEVRLEIKEATGEPVPVYTATPGDLMGWSPMLGRRAMTATARSITPCRVAVFDANQVQEMCGKDPHLEIAILREIAVVLSDRLSATRRCLAQARSQSHRSPFAAYEGSD